MDVCREAVSGHLPHYVAGSVQRLPKLSIGSEALQAPAVGKETPEGRCAAQSKGEEGGAEVLLPPLPLDAAALNTFDTVEVRDPNEMGTTSSVSLRMRGDSTLFSYQLQDRALLRAKFHEPITIIAERRVGSMEITLSADRFATQVALNGDGVEFFLFLLDTLWQCTTNVE